MAVADTDSWDLELRMAELALVDILAAADADNDVDSYWADTAGQAIVDILEPQEQNMEQAEVENFRALDQKQVAGSLAEMRAALECRKLEEAVEHMEKELQSISEASELEGLATSLEIADSDCCCMLDHCSLVELGQLQLRQAAAEVALAEVELEELVLDPLLVGELAAQLVADHMHMADGVDRADRGEYCRVDWD